MVLESPNRWRVREAKAVEVDQCFFDMKFCGETWFYSYDAIIRIIHMFNPIFPCVNAADDVPFGGDISRFCHKRALRLPSQGCDAVLFWQVSTKQFLGGRGQMDRTK
jgi:hypothetical protein